MNDPLPEYEQIVKECHKRGMVKTSTIGDLSPKEVHLTKVIYDSSLLVQTVPFRVTPTAPLSHKQANGNVNGEIK